MELDFEERIQPGIKFLSILGYKFALPKVFTKWESIAILNADNIKIGNAYFDKTHLEMMGEDEEIKFLAKYSLKRMQEEDKITCTITRKYYHTFYRIQLLLGLKSSLLGNTNLNAKMHVCSDKHQEFALLISDYNHSLILDSFDEVRGKEHLEISQDDRQLLVLHQKENAHDILETKAFYAPDERIYTINKTTYENGEDVRKRFYPLTNKDSLISTLSYYLNEIDPIFKIPFWELNNISNEIFINLFSLSFPDFKEEDMANLFGINKKKELSRKLVREKEN